MLCIVDLLKLMSYINWFETIPIHCHRIISFLLIYSPKNVQLDYCDLEYSSQMKFNWPICWDLISHARDYFVVPLNKLKQKSML